MTTSPPPAALPTPAKVRWGVLTTALIGTQKVIPALRKAHNVARVAIASRSAGTAQAAAHALGIPSAHASYEALLADPAVGVVYNPLPNHLHVPWTLAAVQAGIHVLCDKPMALSAAELEALRPYAGQVHIAEAFMVRHHPRRIAARRCGPAPSVTCAACRWPSATSTTTPPISATGPTSAAVRSTTSAAMRWWPGAGRQHAALDHRAGGRPIPVAGRGVLTRGARTGAQCTRAGRRGWLQTS